MMGFFKKDDCNKHYKMGKTLGTGSFATVKLAVGRSDATEWAVKCINKGSLTKEDEAALEVEVNILGQVKHPNIVEMKEIFDCPKVFYLVMEIMRGGELFDRIVEKEKYSENEAQKVIIDISNALKYCHEKGIVHRDLKPENLLYDSEKEDAIIKIADFGLAKLVDDNTMMKTACGTPGYVAPEVLKKMRYTYKVDMWSVGVILYILLCGFPPFYDDNNVRLFSQIKTGRFDYPSPYWDGVSDEAKDLINKLLVVNPEERLDTAGVLAHPWIAGEASKSELAMAKEEMKKYNARRRFRSGIRTARIINAFTAK
jgi:calcium/calmodulin-dependent protein kinase I